MSLQQYLAHQVKMAHQVAENGAPSRALNLKEVKQLQQQPARKPMGVEIPPEYTINKFGREVLNPAWVKYRDLSRSTRERVARARNPEAYWRAIVQRERLG